MMHAVRCLLNMFWVHMWVDSHRLNICLTQLQSDKTWLILSQVSSFYVVCFRQSNNSALWGRWRVKYQRKAMPRNLFSPSHSSGVQYALLGLLPFPKGTVFFHMLLEWVFYRLEHFYSQRRNPYYSADHTQIQIVSGNISFGFSSPFLHWGVQGPSFLSLLLSVLWCIFFPTVTDTQQYFAFFSQQMSKITIFCIASCSHTRLT